MARYYVANPCVFMDSIWFTPFTEKKPTHMKLNLECHWGVQMTLYFSQTPCATSPQNLLGNSAVLWGSPGLQVAQILIWYNYVKQQKKLGLKNFYMTTRSPALLLESCAVVVIDFFHFYVSGSNVVADLSQSSLLWIFISLLLFVLCHNVFQCNCIVSFWSISGWSGEEVFVWVWLWRAVRWMDGCHYQGQVGLYTIFFFFLDSRGAASHH